MSCSDEEAAEVARTATRVVELVATGHDVPILEAYDILAALDPEQLRRLILNMASGYAHLLRSAGVDPTHLMASTEATIARARSRIGDV